MTTTASLSDRADALIAAAQTGPSESADAAKARVLALLAPADPVSLTAASEALRIAVTSCGHSIDRDAVVLRLDPDREGHNALNQLGRRLDAAVGDLLARGVVGAVPVPGATVALSEALLDAAAFEGERHIQVAYEWTDEQFRQHWKNMEQGGRAAAARDQARRIIEKALALLADASGTQPAEGGPPATATLPTPGSREASSAIDQMLANYGFPSNPKNAARAGWEAARHAVRTLGIPEPVPTSLTLSAVRQDISRANRVDELVGLVIQYAESFKAETVDDYHDRMARIRAWGRIALTPVPVAYGEYTYKTKQATKCAQCGEHKHTPLRMDPMGGYVCLTCIDNWLGALLGDFGKLPPTQEMLALVAAAAAGDEESSADVAPSTAAAGAPAQSVATAPQ